MTAQTTDYFIADHLDESWLPLTMSRFLASTNSGASPFIMDAFQSFSLNASSAMSDADLLAMMNTSGLSTTSSPRLRFATVYPNSFRITATLIHAFLFIVGFVGNISICVVVRRTRTLHTPTYCYLVSLAAADLLLVCSAIPEALLSYHIYVKQWVLGHAGCSIMVFSTFLAINAGSMSILAFTVERYIAICHPMQAQKVCTVQRARNIILIIWLIVFAYCCPWLYFTTTRPLEYVDVHGMVMCDYRLTRETYLIVFLADFVIFYVLPLFISILLYVRIGCVITRSLKDNSLQQQSNGAALGQKITSSPSVTLVEKEQSSLMTQTGDSLTRVYAKACRKHSAVETRFQVIKMLIVVVVCFAILWAPYRGLLVFNSLAAKPYRNMWLMLFCKTLVYMNSAVNPFLYTVFSKKFRDAFLRILLCHKHSARQTRMMMEMSPKPSFSRSTATTRLTAAHSSGSKIHRSHRTDSSSRVTHTLLAHRDSSKAYDF